MLKLYFSCEQAPSRAVWSTSIEAINELVISEAPTTCQHSLLACSSLKASMLVL